MLSCLVVADSVSALSLVSSDPSVVCVCVLCVCVCSLSTFQFVITLNSQQLYQLLKGCSQASTLLERQGACEFMPLPLQTALINDKQVWSINIPAPLPLMETTLSGKLCCLQSFPAGPSKSYCSGFKICPQIIWGSSLKKVKANFSSPYM